MVSFDTTATAQDDSYMDQQRKISNYNFDNIRTSASATAGEHAIMNFVVPPKPIGADGIKRVLLTLTQRMTIGVSDPSLGNMNAWTFDRNWVETQVTWNVWSTGNNWGISGGDIKDNVGNLYVTSNAGSSFTWDITDSGLDWDGHIGIILADTKSTTWTGSNRFGWVWYALETTATVGMMPHITIRATDNPPIAITDLHVEPDRSLSESSYTFRQRAVLKWSASDEDDFKRYRIRVGKNRSLAANLTHLAFVSSRGTTSYLDTTLYSDGTTIYYAIYPEDQRNGSTSTALGATYTNVSNIVSWQKPQVSNLAADDFTPDVLQKVTTTVRAATMTNAKQ